MPPIDEDEPSFEAHGGLLPVVTQDADTGEVLMLAWMSAASLAATRHSGLATYFSRSRNTLWTKGATSGNIQQVIAIHLDCDGDALLLKVRQQGVACHTGHRSCFYRSLSDPSTNSAGDE